VSRVAQALSKRDCPPKLRHLELNASGVEPESLPELSAISSLESLSILGNGLGDGCLEILGRLLCVTAGTTEVASAVATETVASAQPPVMEIPAQGKCLESTNKNDSTQTGVRTPTGVPTIPPFLGLRSLNVSGNALTGSAAGAWLRVLAQSHAQVCNV
jgi:hypothetical protein